MRGQSSISPGKAARSCDIDEVFINNFNAEWIVAWDANIDISPVYDYYGTITYITDYFTKVSSILKLKHSKI